MIYVLILLLDLIEPQLFLGRILIITILDEVQGMEVDLRYENLCK